MVIRVILSLALLMSFATQALTQLSASVDKNPVMQNESLILTLVADDHLRGNALDFNVLTPLFNVVRITPTTRTQIINDNVSNMTVWEVVLLPKEPGRVVIPGFSAQGVSSDPIELEILPEGQSSQGKAKEYFLETSVDKTSAYLQSAITYTSKLYLSLDFQRGSLTEPQMENANIAQIGDKQDAESSEIRNGVRYRVITRVYSITPQRSGTYTITPPLFSGELIVNRRRTFLSGFNDTKPVSVAGDKITIEVLPIPQDYQGQWLPSEKVVLQEQWKPQANSYKVGDPITRTITLSAIGVNEEQLPEIEVSYPDTVKTYPDQSTLNSATKNNRLIAQRIDTVAIVPAKPGQLLLPEVKVPWFNTNTNQTEFATLPAKTIHVEPAQVKPIDSQGVAPIASEQSQTSPQPTEVVTEIKEVPVNSLMTWGFLAAWLLTLVGWIVHVSLLKSKHKAAQQQNDSQGATLGRTYWNLFDKACKAGDGHAASKELVRWARARWPVQHFTTTMEVAQFLGSDEVISAVKELQASLYGPKRNNWNGEALHTAVSNNKNPKSEQKGQTFEPLHP